MSDLKIGMPISSFLPAVGGMEVGLHNIAKGLVARGQNPIVFAPAGNVRALRKAGWQLPYEVASFPPKLLTLIEKTPRMALIAFKGFFAWARRHYGIDVWHGTMGYPIGVALAYARGSGAPALVRCAGQDIQTDRGIGYGLRLDPAIDAMIRTWLPRIPLLASISESVTEEYRALGIPDERIVAIPNGVSLGRFRSVRPRLQVRSELGLKPDSFVFLTVARNHPKKNLSAVVEAAGILAGRQPKLEWTAVIVGKGVPDLQPVVDRLGINEQVRLINEISATSNSNDDGFPPQSLIDLYGAADAFVFPSLIETFGIAIVEAMAAGLPVIAGSSPGCRDVVGDGQFGILVPPRDNKAIADVMERLATNPAERAHYAALALKRARYYDWDHVVDCYLTAYRGLLADAR
jgi:glycosyltransferase involved in cell wall biosynthesis